MMTHLTSPKKRFRKEHILPASIVGISALSFVAGTQLNRTPESDKAYTDIVGRTDPKTPVDADLKDFALNIAVGKDFGYAAISEPQNYKVMKMLGVGDLDAEIPLDVQIKNSGGARLKVQVSQDDKVTPVNTRGGTVVFFTSGELKQVAAFRAKETKGKLTLTPAGTSLTIDKQNLEEKLYADGKAAIRQQFAENTRSSGR